MACIEACIAPAETLRGSALYTLRYALTRAREPCPIPFVRARAAHARGSRRTSLRSLPVSRIQRVYRLARRSGTARRRQAGRTEPPQACLAACREWGSRSRGRCSMRRNRGDNSWVPWLGDRYHSALIGTQTGAQHRPNKALAYPLRPLHTIEAWPSLTSRRATW